MEKRDKIIIVGLIIVIIALITGLAFMLMDNTSPKQESQINILGNSTVSEGDSISVKLSSNGTVLKDEILHVSVLNGSGDEILYKSVKTNSKGIAKLALENVSAGSYEVNVTFRGDENYSATNASKSITVNEKVVEAAPQVSESNHETAQSTSDASQASSDNPADFDGDGRSDVFYSESYDEDLGHIGYLDFSDGYRMTVFEDGEYYVEDANGYIGGGYLDEME